MNKRPHILIFNPDQWRGDVLHHMGNAGAVTPHLDRFAQTEGISFRNAFCQTPACTPSRCSYMSGWYPHVRGHRTMQHMMAPDEPVLLRTLKNEGYHVWWGGKNDLVPGENGVEDYCTVKHPKGKKLLQPREGWRGEPGSNTYYSFYQGRLTLPEGSGGAPDSDWHHVYGALDQIRNAPGDQPLCIYLPLTYPHPPYGVEEPWYSMIDRSKVPPRIPTPTNWDDKPQCYKTIHDRANIIGWTKEQWTDMQATYYGMCARVDHQFGMVLNALREAGLYDDTAIFFFSDHGDFTGDYGLVQKVSNVFPECMVRVPFLIKPPSWIPVEPGISDALVELTDFPATVEELAGIKPEHTHFGRSLMPVLRGETTEHRDAVFSEGGRLPDEEQTRDLELVKGQIQESLYWPTLSLKRDDGPESMKAVMCRTKDYKFVRRLCERDELYDLQNDPDETINLIDDPALFPIVSDFKERVLTFYQETCDVVPFKQNRRNV